MNQIRCPLLATHREAGPNNTIVPLNPTWVVNTRLRRVRANHLYRRNTSATVLTTRVYTYAVNGAKDRVLRKTMTTDTGASTKTWAYDKNGNRTQITKSGTVHSACNDAGQFCWTGADSPHR